MRKLLLVSMLQNTAHILRAVEPELKNKTITYIPTAGNAEKYRFLFKLRKFSFKSMGLTIDELDYSILGLPIRQKRNKSFTDRYSFWYLNQEYLSANIKRTAA